MARPEEAKWVQKMREGTWKDKMFAWGFQTPGRDMQRSLQTWGFWIDKKPEIFEALHTQYEEIVDRGIFDRVTRELMLLSAGMGKEGLTSGIISHWQNAKAAGVTEEVMYELGAIAAYMAERRAAASIGAALSEVFNESSGDKLWKKKKPEITEYIKKQYERIKGRKILDPQTIQLCMVSMAIGMLSKGSSQESVNIVEICKEAKATGVTDEEILEIAAIQCYSAIKSNAGINSVALQEAFKVGANVTLYKG